MIDTLKNHFKNIIKATELTYKSQENIEGEGFNGQLEKSTLELLKASEELKLINL